MEISRSTVKKLMGLIVFAAVCFALSRQPEAIGSIFAFLLSMLSPFLIGGALALLMAPALRKALRQ